MTDSVLVQAAGLRRGTANEPVCPAWLLVLAGRVVHLGPLPPPTTPPGVPTFRGGWLSDPWLDAHVHLFLGGAFDVEERRRLAALDPAAALERCLGLLADYRSRGIAGARDAGDPAGLALAAAQIARRHPERYAQVFPSGQALHLPGGYGSFLGVPVADGGSAARVIAENAAAGATQIKVLATGLNSLERPGNVEGPSLGREQLQQWGRLAWEYGLPLMVHANGSPTAVAGLEHGTLEHGFGIQPGDMQLLAVQHTPWTPTLRAWGTLAEHPGLEPLQKAVVATTHGRQREAVAAARAAGVALLAGSDAGTPGVSHGTGLFRELQELVAAGLEPWEAHRAATLALRGVLGAAGGRLGSLTPGDRAAFVLLDADPAEPASWGSRPRAVWIAGRGAVTDRAPGAAAH